MPEPSLDDFRRAYMRNIEVFNRHDFAAAFAAFPDDFEWHTFDDDLFGRGPQEVRLGFEEVVRDLPDWRVEPPPGETEWFQLWQFSDGLPRRVREYRTRTEALEAAALS